MLSTKKSECKTALFANNNTEDDHGADNLSRTFILSPGEEETTARKKDATFSPEKQPIEIDKKEELQAIEIPVDAEERKSFAEEINASMKPQTEKHIAEIRNNEAETLQKLLALEESNNVEVSQPSANKLHKDIDLEGSLTEDMVIREELKEENTKITIEEHADKNRLVLVKAEKFVSECESVEKTLTHPTHGELLVENQSAEHVEASTTLVATYLDTSENMQNKLQNVNENENITKLNEINDDNLGTEITQHNDEISEVKILDNKSTENELTTSNKNESLNVNNTKEVDGNTKQTKVINKDVENIAASFTPRRSTRRASQSSDVLETVTELAFTPRRSTRRASMSAESATTTACTMCNDTTLTPKPITKRRLSISVDDETLTPSTSKLQQRAKTPRKQFEQSMSIPEESEEICMEAKEEPEQKTIQYEEKKITALTNVKELETKINEKKTGNNYPD
ncbi:hypothetical protein EVAR_67964_1 [Eumeta japonica]|uniref:Uncharacterized protein n=1 Tax=Eumeta variegata TaxID=151549 RepID=A0A4C1ZWW3_EUMVA|nr:hypothetical protein EVAR_67964_1 [Eumeta japonica]